MAADLTKSVQHRVYDLFVNGIIKDVVLSTGQSVTVPSITDPDIAKVDVAVTGITVAVGDMVLVAPKEALPTNCRLQGAFVTASNVVTFTFGSEGGNVTGAAKLFDILVLDRT